MNQNNDDMSCVTGVTGTTGTKFYTQHTRFNIPKEIRHAVDESQIKSKTKRAAVDLVNLQDFMDTISHQPSEWEDMEHCYMTHDFGGFGIYLGHHAKNKTIV